MSGSTRLRRPERRSPALPGGHSGNDGTVVDGMNKRRLLSFKPLLPLKDKGVLIAPVRGNVSRAESGRLRHRNQKAETKDSQQRESDYATVLIGFHIPAAATAVSEATITRIIAISIIGTPFVTADPLWRTRRPRPGVCRG